MVSYMNDYDLTMGKEVSFGHSPAEQRTGRLSEELENVVSFTEALPGWIDSRISSIPSPQSGGYDSHQILLWHPFGPFQSVKSQPPQPFLQSQSAANGSTRPCKPQH
jgi:hypothetical protein